ITLALSCTKHQALPPVTTLVSQINSDTQLVILNAAVKRLQLDTAFSSGGPYTLFAPVDSAFLAAGITVQTINELSLDSLRQMVGYHIVYGRISSTDLLGFLRKRLRSLARYEPFISKNYYGIYINGIHVREGNISCVDGVLHKIEGVSKPPRGNL